MRKLTTSGTVSSAYSFYPFSTSTLNDILGKFSEVSLKNIILGYMFMVIFFFLIHSFLFHFFLVILSYFYLLYYFS